jgi:acetolactate synthase-1/2/3 large subunit
MRIDHQALFKPLTKASFSAADQPLEQILPRLFAIARNEPPGPVHLDLPEDIAQQVGLPPRSITGAPAGKDPACVDVAGAVAAALEKSRRPLVVTGLTFTRSNAGGKLLRFVERQNLPFISTLHAKGFLPESHLHWAGVIGRARRTNVQAFADRADLIIAVGFDPIEINYEDWARATPIVHISTEAAERSPETNLIWNHPCDLDASIAAISELPQYTNDWSVDEWRVHREKLDQALRPEGPSFGVQAVLDILRRQLPPEGILAYDVGAHTHQIATQWRTDRPRTLLATNGWSSMGYGMPAAYAAKLVHRDRPVVCVLGDGGFQMTAGELALARRLNLDVPVIVLNDGWLGLMKIKQERKHYSLSGVRLGDPPDSPAHYFGVPCRSAKTADEFSTALSGALSLPGPSVIETFIDVESYSQTVFD